MKKSSLYAERIYKDHPIACWPLDDEISYVQIFTASQQSETGWTGTSESSSLPAIEGSIAIDHSFSSSSSDYTTTLDSSFSISTSSIPSGSYCFSVFINHQNYLAYTYEIGIKYGIVEEFSTYSLGLNYGWQNMIHSFEMPTSTNVSFYIKAYMYAHGPSTLTFSSFSLGQNSEPFCAYAMGVTSTALDSEIINVLNNNTQYTVGSNLDAYSVTPEFNGVYIWESDKIMVSPSGMPMAYGSYQSININQVSDNNPSILLPNTGFMNESGINNSYTLEFWMRISNSSQDPVKVIGPINSNDGLYIEGGFVTLKVGLQSKSYFVGQWYRPMLMHMKYSPHQASLMINGESVILIDLNTEDKNFPTSTYDYIGVYGNSSIYPLEIDCISVFPYLMPPQMAKIHFVYGQGVQELDFSNNKFLKKTVQIEYPMAGYSYNVIYPDTIKWRSGFSINLNSSSSMIRTREYALPSFVGKKDGIAIDESTWRQDNLLANQSSSQFRTYAKSDPTANTYDSSCFYYSNLNLAQNRIYGILGVFKSPSSTASNQTIFIINNKSTGEKIKCSLSGTTLDYSYIDPSAVSTSLQQYTVSTNTTFVAGIDINKFSVENYSLVGSFFSSWDNLSMNFMGSNNSDKFNGMMFALNFIDEPAFKRDFSSHSNSFFDANTLATQYADYISNYTLIPVVHNGASYLDVCSYGYWEDVLPLSMFGKNVSVSSLMTYDLDFIQINIDNPYDFLGETSTTAPESNLSTHSKIRSYITIQPNSTAGTIPYSTFTNIVRVDGSNSITINPLDISNTKYEFFDSHVVNIPKTIDFNEYFIGIHIEIIAKESNSKPILIKKLELSSFAANDFDTKIGTKFGENIYSFGAAV